MDKVQKPINSECYAPSPEPLESTYISEQANNLDSTYELNARYY